MARTTVTMSFEDLYAEAKQRCDSFLRSLLSRESSYMALDGPQILQAMTRLQTTINRINGFGDDLSPQPPFNPPNPPNPPPRLPDISPQGNPQPIPPGTIQVVPPSPPITVVGPIEPRDLADTLRQDLEDAKERNRRLQRDMNGLKATLIEVRDHLATKSEQTEDFELAHQQCEALRIVKAEEKQKLRHNNQATPEYKVVEEQELAYAYRSAKMLVKLGRYSDAEAAFNYVLRTRLFPHNDPGGELQITREVQLAFCNALRLHGSAAAIIQAEDLYYRAANLESQNSRNGDNLNWALRNAFKLASLKARQGDHRSAVNRLQDVWSKRHGASEDCLMEMQDELAGLLEDFGAQHLEVYSMIVPGVVHESEALAPRLVEAVIATGLRLYNDRQYAPAVEYLHMAWNNRSRAAPQDELALGWALAWSLCQAGPHNQAECERVLEALVESFNARPPLREHRVRALLARVQHDLGKFTSARQNAQIVYKDYKTQNILELYDYHHVDTLIRAMALGPHYSGRWCKASGIWNHVYEYAQNLPRSISNRQQQVRRHGETGRILAEKWILWRKNQRGWRAPTPDTVKTQANRLLRPRSI